MEVDIFADGNDAGGLQGDPKRLNEAVQKAQEMEELLASMELQLKEAKSDYQQLTQQLIPDLLDELGLGEYTTAEGLNVKCADFVMGSLPKENRDGAITWLEDNGYEDIVNHTVSVRFKKGEHEQATVAIEKLEAAGFQRSSIVDNKDVHHSTLKAWAKEQLKEGEEIPLELLGLSVGRVAKIKSKGK